MAPSTNLYAALAGYVGYPDQTGRIGVFRRDAVGGEWQHVLPDLEAFTVIVHPCQPALVLAEVTRPNKDLLIRPCNISIPSPPW